MIVIVSLLRNLVRHTIRPKPSSDRLYQEKRGRSRDRHDHYGPPKKDYVYSNKPRYRDDPYTKPTISERDTLERERKALEDEKIAFENEQEVVAKLARLKELEAKEETTKQQSLQ